MFVHVSLCDTSKWSESFKLYFVLQGVQPSLCSTFFVHFSFSIEPWILKVAPGTELGIMPMEGRKVIYDTGLPDGKGGMWYSLLEPNENTKREGIFLRFGERTIYVEEEKQHFCNTVAIVEDLETGQILVLPPENIKFENN